MTLTQSIVLKILSHLGLGVGFGYLKAPTQNPYPNTQKSHTHTQNPYPNTQKIPYPYPKPIPKYSKNPIPIPIPIPKYSKNPIPIPKTHTQILKKSHTQKQVTQNTHLI